ncbi:MAG: S-methyl-5-thioribose-1-phosphate isomerase [Alphaproteobacteria bacterium]|nr:S-methyl-5-thioribose-1-phosphate isomerase [Alphaproteobacteria bacterium]MDE2013722.1 S-methyl-5-thioribose-1-phosphate isomerase [Alphaproteobacteria bacterium]MDE2074721.1 S-methyl-5-thioribose-1-phosphate isomerase [Alphaproteobacteria bacterium]MDE2352258.1 S-methyl-5-thioribose-1-phosphate isomerase [Alphaproteobacteria bacterium]
MKIAGKHYRTIWPLGEEAVEVIDQTRLPHEFATLTLRTAEDCARAIKTMVVRGAPLIGATAAYGLALAMREDASDAALDAAHDALLATRPTAVNLRWALKRMRDRLRNHAREERAALAWAEAAAICDEDVAVCRAIGEHGLTILRAAAEQKNGKTLNILTHCNAGWLATVDWGTALAPIYLAHDAGIDLHVWVDETRPRNQGASLTAYELGGHGVKHTIIADNAGGHYMQAGKVDLCIVGTDRVTANGDVANKIGTYLKALAAKDNDVPFYVALPSSTIDWSLQSGRDIPIEERADDELLKMTGRLPGGGLATVEIAAPGSPGANPAFDVTPARLVTGFITERGVCAATEAGLRGLFPK